MIISTTKKKKGMFKMKEKLEEMRPQVMVVSEDGSVEIKRDGVVRTLPISAEETESFLLDRLEVLSSHKQYNLSTAPRTAGAYALYFTKPHKHGYIYVGYSSHIMKTLRCMRSGRQGERLESVWQEYGAPQVYLLSDTQYRDENELEKFGEALHADLGKYAQTPDLSKDEAVLKARRECLQRALWSGSIKDLIKLDEQFTMGAYVLEFNDGRIYVGSASVSVPARMQTHIWHEESKRYRETWSDNRRLYHEWKRQEGDPKAYVITTDDDAYREHEKDLIFLLRPELNRVS